MLYAQESNSNYDTEYRLQTSFYGSMGKGLPFWFYSNVNGKIDPSSENWLNEVKLNHRLLDLDKISVDLGGEAVFRLSHNSTVLFPKAYLKAKAYGLQLDAGRFSQLIGLNNRDLSSGSMMVSDNAMSPPRISISIPDFMDVPYADGYVQYKGMFSHGWFEEDRYVERPYLHQKNFYLKVNVGPWSVIGGIVHNAQWGGIDPDRGRLPQSFGDYLRLVTGQGADESSNAPGGEVINVIGNTVAAYDFGLEYEHEAYTFSLTRMFYLEDKVSARFRSPWDGVWGANLKFKDENHWFNAVTYEHINTKNQDAKSWELIGRRDYYDNFLYRSGWTYENRTLGTPFILFKGNTISNNVLVGHHLGLTGRLSQNINYRTLISYTRNYGVQDDWVTQGSDSIPNDSDVIIAPVGEFRTDQYSLLVEFDYQIKSIEGLGIKFKVGSDIGELYDDNLGMMLGLQWRGISD